MVFFCRIQSIRFFGIAVFLACSLVAPMCWAFTFQQHSHLYQSFDELTTWVGDFATTNSDIVELVEFGRSHQDRPLFALRFSIDPGINDPSKPEFLFTAGLHAREVIGSQAAYRLAEQLVDGFRANDPATVAAITEREVWIVPNLNPDGRVSVEGGNSRQRKTMQWYPGQSYSSWTRGVDLNRNFPHRWEDASATVNSETYRGPSVLSTPEASSLWEMLENDDYFSDLWAAVDIHSGAETILSAWTSREDILNNPLPPEEQAKYDFLSTRMAEETGLDTERLWYPSYGVLADALYENFGAYSFVEEIYRGPWSGDFFQLFNPLDQAGVDEATATAISSSLFLLSDEAFAIVPEPSTFTLLGFFGCILAFRRIRELP